MAVHCNTTKVTKFILLGFTSERNLQLLLFSFFLPMYLLSVAGNLGLAILIRAERALQTPMYYFLSHLALMDLCSCCTVAPKMLLGLLKGCDSIPIPACGLQMLSFAAASDAECCLLAAMAYDRSFRAMSTCGSHLTVVGVLYGTLIFMYLRPDGTYAPQTDKMTSVFYTVVIPTLNPAIYSLRNTDVKHAVKKRLSSGRHQF
ncbi:Olfactory receptor 5C1, partial [Ophiophagus hannah]